MEVMCEGCFEYNSGRETHAYLKLDIDENTLFCSVVPEKDGRQCPCITCLVKMMDCKEPPCERFIEYMNFVDEEDPRG
jgi:hypothetical protein